MSCAKRSAGLAFGFSSAAAAGGGFPLFCASASRRAWAMSAASREESFSFSMGSHENDIELLLSVARLDLHRHGLAYEVSEHRQGLRFLLQEQVDHRLRGEDAELARVELARLAQDFAQDLVAHGLRGLDHATPAAARAGLAQHVLER